MKGENNMIEWPNGKKVAVSIAFDVDLELNWSESNRLDPGHIVHMSKGTYGAKQGIPRILSMLDKQEIKGTFFIPAYNAEVYPELIKEISRRGHEIACHGYHHYGISERTYEDDNKMLEKCEQIFMELTGQKIVGFRPCGEEYRDFVVKLLLNRGYKYMSFRGDWDGPRICELDGNRIPLVDLCSDVFYDDTAYDYYIDSPPARYGIKSSSEQFKIWSDEFDGMSTESGKVMDFVIHPQFIGRSCRVNMLGELISYMKERGAWLATNKEIAEWVLDQNGF